MAEQVVRLQLMPTEREVALVEWDRLIAAFSIGVARRRSRRLPESALI